MPPTAHPERVGIAIGPQYGTVSPSYVKDAAREAIQAERHRPALRPRLRLRPQRSLGKTDDYVDRPTKASPRSRPSAGSAGSRC